MDRSGTKSEYRSSNVGHRFLASKVRGARIAREGEPSVRKFPRGKAPAHRRRRRPALFHPVPLRARADGWSEARQCGFLAQLYLTGSVTAAARAVGMTRASVYRLRARCGAESFAHAWDQVLTPPGTGRCPALKEDFRKVTDLTLNQRLEAGLVQPRSLSWMHDRDPPQSRRFRAFPAVAAAGCGA